MLSDDTALITWNGLILLGNLADRLNSVELPVSTSRERIKHPNGWEPGIVYDPETDVPLTVTTPLIPNLQGDFSKVMSVLGEQLPEGYRLALEKASYDPAAWHRDNEFITNPDTERSVKAPAVTRPAWRYKFKVVKIENKNSVPAVSTLSQLRRTPKPRRTLTGEASFVLEWNDWQMGKKEGGGSAATIERVHNAFEAAAEQIKFLRKAGVPIGSLQILGVGDMVEGCSIYPNQEYHIDGDLRDQRNNTTDLIVAGLDRLAQYFEDVHVMVVPGNHGERRVNGKRVNKHDNDDCLVFENAAREVSRDSRLGHVRFMISDDQIALTREIKGHILGITHGDAYGKTPGGSAEAKARKWFAGQAAGRQPIGDADVLITAHFHHELKANWGATLFSQGPAMDGGSPQFTDISGTWAEPGMLSFVMTEQNKYGREEILR